MNTNWLHHMLTYFYKINSRYSSLRLFDEKWLCWKYRRNLKYGSNWWNHWIQSEIFKWNIYRKYRLNGKTTNIWAYRRYFYISIQKFNIHFTQILNSNDLPSQKIVQLKHYNKTIKIQTEIKPPTIGSINFDHRSFVHMKRNHFFLDLLCLKLVLLFVSIFVWFFGSLSILCDRPKELAYPQFRSVLYHASLQI